MFRRLPGSSEPTVAVPRDVSVNWCLKEICTIDRGYLFNYLLKATKVFKGYWSLSFVKGTIEIILWTHFMWIITVLLLTTDRERRSFSSARFCVIGELLVNFGQNVNHKCMEKN